MADDVIECDVLVAGSGAGGFAAALTAHLQGRDVIMVEKEALFGGTTAYSAGVLWVPLSHHQKNAGLTDSREDALAYLVSQAGNHLDRARAEKFLDAAPEMVELFEDNGFLSLEVAPTWADYHPDEPGGVKGGRSLVPNDYDGQELGGWFAKLRPPIGTMMAFGGMMVGRNDMPHVFKMTRSLRSARHVASMVARYARDRLSHHRGTRLVNGNALIARLAVAAINRGIPLWLSTPVIDLVQERGAVIGARIERGGKPVTVRARCGVILATGGFPRNQSRTESVYRHLAANQNHVTLPPPGNTGDGLRLAGSVGGHFYTDLDQPAAWTPVSMVPQSDGSMLPYPHFLDRGKPGFISVDRRGKRFVNEAQSYHVFTAAMMEACRLDDRVEAWIICDHRAIRRYGLGALGPPPVRLKPFIESGYIIRVETVAALAAACSIDSATLTATIDAFNRHAARGEDPEFGRGGDAYQVFNGDPRNKPNACLATLEFPPFYAVKMEPGELGTFAGIATNADAQVIGQSGGPITGLYAVGNDAASVMGGTYPGAGITIGPAMAFGFIAARHASE